MPKDEWQWPTRWMSSESGFGLNNLNFTLPLYLQALKAKNPHLFTIATLTGHIVLSYGLHCAAAMDNGPARAVHYAEQLQRTGDAFGQSVEVSRLFNEVKID